MWCVHGVTGCIDRYCHWHWASGVGRCGVAAAGGGIRSSETLRYYWPAGLGLLLLGLGICMRKLLVYQRHIVCRSMHQIEPFGGQNWKKSLPWEGGQPPSGQPPSHTLPPLGRYAPLGLVASLPRKVAIFLGIFSFKCWEVWIGDFRNVFKFHAYSLNKRLFLTTAKLVRGLSDVATTNVCKVDTSNRNHIERSRWMKWLITGLRQKKYPLIWIHYGSPLLNLCYLHVAKQHTKRVLGSSTEWLVSEPQTLSSQYFFYLVLEFMDWLYSLELWVPSDSELHVICLHLIIGFRRPLLYLLPMQYN